MKKISEIEQGVQITEKGAHLTEPRTAIIEANSSVKCQLSSGNHYFINRSHYETLIHGFLSLKKTGFSCEEEDILDGFGYYCLIKKGQFYSPVYIFWNINDTRQFISNLILEKIKSILDTSKRKKSQESVKIFTDKEKHRVLSLKQFQRIDRKQGWEQIVHQWKCQKKQK